MQIKSAALTAIGKARSINEDSFYINGIYKEKAMAKEESFVNTSQNRGLYAVCDGMGGANDGFVASYICARLLEDYQSKGVDEMESYFTEANRMVCKYIDEHNGKPTGSTVAAVFADNGCATVFNIGDSRVYFLRESELTKISVDHTSAQRMVNMGLLSAEQADKDASRHTLTQHVGIHESELVIEPYRSKPIFLKKRDRFMLCSDGLYESINETVIKSIISDLSAEPMEICRRLVDSGANSGGKDDITVVIIDIC